MKTYNNIKEVEADIVDGVLKVDDDIQIAFDGFNINADIVCHNIYSKGYRRNIDAENITAWNIDAWNINAVDIDAWNINAVDINAVDINAWDINAVDINAWDISYYAVCSAYNNITCKSIEGRRENAKHFCLDGEITIKKEDDKIEEAMQLLKDNGYKVIKD